MDHQDSSYTYDHVSCRLFSFVGIKEDAYSVEFLAEVFQEYGYQVSTGTDVSFGLGTGNNTSEMVNRVRECLKELEAKEGKKLAIFYYLGHGGKEKDGTLGMSNNEGVGFNLSKLQECARDEYEVDVLFFFECCHGEVNGMKPQASTSRTPQKKMETVAAGTGTIETGNWNDFSRLFGADLRVDRTPRTVEELCSDSQGNNPTAPGYYRRDCGQSSIMLHPLKK